MPMDLSERTIPRLVRRAAERFPARTAIEDEGFAPSFPELLEAVRAASRALIAAGIDHGDRVAIWAPNVHEWVIAALAVHGVGGVLVPLNTRMKGGEAGYVLETSRARLLFTVAAFLENRYVTMLRDALGGRGSRHPVGRWRNRPWGHCRSW